MCVRAFYMDSILWLNHVSSLFHIYIITQNLQSLSHQGRWVQNNGQFPSDSFCQVFNQGSGCQSPEIPTSRRTSWRPPRCDSLCRRFDGGRSKVLRMLMGETEPKTVAREDPRGSKTLVNMVNIARTWHCPALHEPIWQDTCRQVRLDVCVCYVNYISMYLYIYI